VSGDLTQRARQRLVIPGNHDSPMFDLLARLAWPYRGFRRAFGARHAAPLPRSCRAGPASLVIVATRPRRSLPC